MSSASVCFDTGQNTSCDVYDITHLKTRNFDLRFKFISAVLIPCCKALQNHLRNSLLGLRADRSLFEVAVSLIWMFQKIHIEKFSFFLPPPAITSIVNMLEAVYSGFSSVLYACVELTDNRHPCVRPGKSCFFCYSFGFGSHKAESRLPHSTWLCQKPRKVICSHFFCLVFVLKVLVLLRENNLTEFLAIRRKHLQTIS